MKKLHNLSAGSNNSGFSIARVRLFPEHMVVGQLKLSEVGTAPLLPAFPLTILPFYFRWALAQNQFRRLH